MFAFSDDSAVLAALPQEPAAEQTLRETVNVCIDAIVSTLQRLLELPLVGVLVGSALLAALLWLAAWWRARRGARPWSVGLLRIAGVLVVVAAVMFAVDRRLLRQQERLQQLRAQALAATCDNLERLQQLGLVRAEPLVDVAAAGAALQAQFAGLRLRPVVLDDATDLVLFEGREPLLSGALAVVDLRQPSVQIAMDADFTAKTMTSAFARTHGCTVAINGEAGNSPQPDCGLGRWTGHMRIAGVDVLREQAGNPRPFLAFDRERRARFVAAGAAERSLQPTDHDVIWGRMDAIVDGVVQTEAWRFNQPRTVMGIDRAGERLFLLVVDGRQPRHSVGFTRPQVGAFLHAFGVHDAMLCDEGGSACLYAAAFGGLVTVPSDDQGEERPTYTHFGITRRK